MNPQSSLRGSGSPPPHRLAAAPRPHPRAATAPPAQTMTAAATTAPPAPTAIADPQSSLQTISRQEHSFTACYPLAGDGGGGTGGASPEG